MSSEVNQVEHEHISRSLEVERIETNIYRSKSLWIPLRARGVFGGQVISQALVSVTNAINPQYSLHSLHCYFLTSASSAVPILYEIDRVRNGRTYVARVVRAIQNGHVIFVMLCSFQKPEPWQPGHQFPMPSVRPPKECELEEDRLQKLARQEGLDPRIKEVHKQAAEQQAHGPLSIKIAADHQVGLDGTIQYMYWMKAKDIPHYDAPFQKCILGYISDMRLINTAGKSLGLQQGGRGPTALSMTSTLDHAIWYYSDDFHCGDWLLYVMNSPRTGTGRGVVHGKIYTQDGKLIAVTTQEGVVRADIREPQKELVSETGEHNLSLSAKL